MPPKRAPKRKESSPNGDFQEGPSKSNKKAKVSDPPPPAEGAQPTNKVLPVNISFPVRVPNTLRLATWNVCGLAASQKKVGSTIHPVAVVPNIVTGI